MIIFAFLLSSFPLSVNAHTKKSGRSKNHITNYEKLSKRKRKCRKSKKKKCRKKRKKKKKGHVHAEGEGHGDEMEQEEGHAHQKWSASIGMALAQQFDFFPEEETTEGSSGFRLLSPGHGGPEPAPSDDGSGGETDGDESFKPVFDGSIGYAIGHSFNLNLGLGYSIDSGITDPTFGGAFTLPFSSRTDGSLSLSSSYPLSKYSQDDFKITTITGSAGIRHRASRWIFGFTGLIAYSWYSKTIIYVDEDGNTSTSANLLDAGHAGGGASTTTGSNTTEDGKLKREFSRYGGNFDLVYRASNSVSLAGAFSVTLIGHQFEPPVWFTDTTFLKASYTTHGFTTSLGFAMSGEEESFAFPTQPRIGLGIRYEI